MDLILNAILSRFRYQANADGDVYGVACAHIQITRMTQSCDVNSATTFAALKLEWEIEWDNDCNSLSSVQKSIEWANRLFRFLTWSKLPNI